jgi:hypothetical protein
MNRALVIGVGIVRSVYLSDSPAVTMNDGYCATTSDGGLVPPLLWVEESPVPASSALA